MNKSIQHFCENETKNLEKVILNFFQKPEDIAELVQGISKAVLKLGCDIIGETFSEYNQMLKDSSARKQRWDVVRTDQKTLLTSLGEVHFQKTLFRNKKTGNRVYLLDKSLDIAENARLSEDAEAQLLIEAVQSSYRRAGDATSLSAGVSKATVKNKLHSLEFPKYEPKESTKRQVKCLYIDADEDHVPLQFIQDKGDTKDAHGFPLHKKAIAKLVYVYEGVEPEAPKSTRYKLINPHYFGGVCEGKDNAKLWEEVRHYIESTYDAGSIEHIFLNSDDGGWIKEGARAIPNVIRVLDEYHLNKYLTQLTSHLYDSAEDERNHLRKIIKYGNKADFIQEVDLILKYAENEDAEKRINQASRYILNCWSSSRYRLLKREGVVGSSTEAHVSHVLADRLSSRPLGWSKTGVDKMTKLRIYNANKGNMLDLVRYQKTAAQSVAVGETYLSAADISSWEKHHFIPNGKYYEKMHASPSILIRKMLAISERIYI